MGLGGGSAEALSGVVVDVIHVAGVGLSGGVSMLGGVIDDGHVDGVRRRGCAARRVRMPSSGVESWTVVGPDGRLVWLVGVVDEFLGWLTGIERSPNTVEAYARDLAAFWSFLGERGLEWDRVSVAVVGRVRGVGAKAGAECAGAQRAGGEAVGGDREPDADGGGVVVRVPGAAWEHAGRAVDLVVCKLSRARRHALGRRAD